VSYSPVLKWFVALLLPMTLAWKLTIGPDHSHELKEQIVGFLVRHQFEVTIIDEIIEDMPAIRASREGCHMTISKTSPYGWRKHMISELAAATDRVFIVFRGMVYTEQPTWLTLGSHLWSRFLRESGFRRHITPVIAVVATATCDAERLPWYELHEGGEP
jgi:hypothetical protein